MEHRYSDIYNNNNSSNLGAEDGAASNQATQFAGDMYLRLLAKGTHKP